MAVTTTAKFLAQIVGLITGDRDVRFEWAITNGIGTTSVSSLSTGANTVTIPTGTTLVVIAPPTSNTQTITLKGVTGDTGVALSKTRPTVLAIDTGVTSIVLTAGGSVSGIEIIFI